MAHKTKAPAGRLLLLCMIIGLLISFGYDPIYFFLLNAIKTNLKISPFEELAAASFLGIFYLGLLVYFTVLGTLNAYAKELMNALLKELREKEILPPGYKKKKVSGFKHIHEEIMVIFGGFIETFMKVQKDKDKFSKTMDKYLDPSLKKEIDERNLSEIYIGVKKKTATIFFSDLRGFTALTEFHRPEDVVKILNEYFGEATKVIAKYGGRVNKYIGDAILAVFEEAPKYSSVIDSDQAIKASLDIQARFPLLAKKWKQQINPNMSIGLGIGLDRGEIITGNMGTEERMEYTVIGDTVNTSSRLCGMANDGQVLVSEDVFKAVETLVDADAIPDVSIKGKSGTHMVYSIKTRRMLT